MQKRKSQRRKEIQMKMRKKKNRGELFNLPHMKLQNQRSEELCQCNGFLYQNFFISCFTEQQVDLCFCMDCREDVLSSVYRVMYL